MPEGDNKPWYQSKTIWGGVIAAVAAGLGLAGLELGADDQQRLVEIAVSIAGMVGAVLAIYGRMRASKGIGGK